MLLTMKNMFGEEVEVVPLKFEWSGPHLWIFRGKKFFGNVYPNGWNGHSKVIQYELGDPVLTNTDGDLSFKELKQIMDEYWSHITPDEARKLVDVAIKKEKERNS